MSQKKDKTNKEKLSVVGVYLLLVSVIVVFAASFLIFQMAKEGVFRELGTVPLPIFFLVFSAAVWTFVTGIGIIKRKKWARDSLMLLSLSALLIGIIYFWYFVFSPLPEMPSSGCEENGCVPAASDYHLKLVFIVLDSIFLIILPVLFMMRFRKKQSLNLPEEEREIPFFVKIISMTIGIVSFFSFFTVVFPDLSGNIGMMQIGSMSILYKIYVSVSAIFGLYVCWGLLRLKKIAWLGYIVLTILQNITIFFSKTIDPALKEIDPTFYTFMFFKDIFIGIVSIAFIIYMFSKKQIFDK